jgi:transcriptional regulator with XRE-family HTH domain
MARISASTLYCVCAMSPGTLIRDARREAGLTQAELAARLGTTQSAIARLERPDSNPRVATLEAALRAAGRRLEVAAPAGPPEVDEEQIRRQLRMTPTQRLRYHDAARKAQAARAVQASRSE